MRALPFVILIALGAAGPVAAQNDTTRSRVPADTTTGGNARRPTRASPAPRDSTAARRRSLNGKNPPAGDTVAGRARTIVGKEPPAGDTVAGLAPGLVTKEPPTGDTVAALTPGLVSKAAPGGQEPVGITSNLYLPVSSWVTPYVEHLIRAGVLQGLDPLTRPLRRADVARAVARVDTASLAAPVRSELRLLADELAERQDTVRWKLDGGIGALAASDASRWAWRPAGDTARVYPQADLEMSFELPHLAFVTHPYLDNRLKHDPDFTGRKDRFVAGRNDEAYGITSWKYLDVFFGSVSRNWGPPEVEGLILSTAPYAYDHLFLRIGPPRLRVEMLATELNPLQPWGSLTPAKRFLSVHRLVVTPSDRFAFSLSEAIVYADVNGLTRNFEPWYLNPFNLWLLAQYERKPTGNTLVGADFSWLVRPGLRAAAQLYADDIQVDRGTQLDKKPEELGYTLNLTGGALRGLVSWSAFYTRVDALDYRTFSNQEQYSIDSVGLARNHSDYDQLTFRATAAPATRALVSGELTYIRQGQGDFRKQYPDSSLFADSLIFLTGVVERTLRVAAQASWTPLDGIHLSADVGRHFVWNAGHVRGARGDRWVWRLEAQIRRRATGAVPWRE